MIHKLHLSKPITQKNWRGIWSSTKMILLLIITLLNGSQLPICSISQFFNYLMNVKHFWSNFLKNLMMNLFETPSIYIINNISSTEKTVKETVDKDGWVLADGL